MTLNDGDPGERSTSVEGVITAVELFADGSIQYRCEWWDGRRQERGYFQPAFVCEVDDEYPEYLELSPVRGDDEPLF